VTEVKIKASAVIAIFYVIIGLACFGPAQVESERDAMADYQQCKADHGADRCIYWAPMGGVFKAAFWPAWMSYTIARKAAP
jgi:hypothetical protein